MSNNNNDNILKKYSGPLTENRTVFDSTIPGINGKRDRLTRYILGNQNYNFMITLLNSRVTSMNSFEACFPVENGHVRSTINSTSIEQDDYSLIISNLFKKDYQIMYITSSQAKPIDIENSALNWNNFASREDFGRGVSVLEVGWNSLKDPNNIRYLKSIGHYNRIIDTKKLVEALRELFLGNVISHQMLVEIITNGELSEKSRRTVAKLLELKNATRSKQHELLQKIADLENDGRKLDDEFIYDANKILREEDEQEY